MLEKGETINLSFNISEEDSLGKNEVRLLTSFEKGFAYTSSMGAITLFQKDGKNRWI